MPDNKEEKLRDVQDYLETHELYDPSKEEDQKPIDYLPEVIKFIKTRQYSKDDCEDMPLNEKDQRGPQDEKGYADAGMVTGDPEGTDIDPNLVASNDQSMDELNNYDITHKGGFDPLAQAMSQKQPLPPKPEMAQPPNQPAPQPQQVPSNSLADYITRAAAASANALKPAPQPLQLNPGAQAGVNAAANTSGISPVANLTSGAMNALTSGAPAENPYTKQAAQQYFADKGNLNLPPKAPAAPSIPNAVPKGAEVLPETNYAGEMGKTIANEQAGVNNLAKGYNSPGNVVMKGLAAVADGIMQGVARAGRSEFLQDIQQAQKDAQERAQRQGETISQQQMQRIAMQKEMDKDDPRSAISQNRVNGRANFLAGIGIKPTDMKFLSANDVDGLASQALTLKDVEAKVQESKTQALVSASDAIDRQIETLQNVQSQHWFQMLPIGGQSEAMQQINGQIKALQGQKNTYQQLLQSKDYLNTGNGANKSNQSGRVTTARGTTYTVTK